MDDLALLNHNPLPALLSAGVPLTSLPGDGLHGWQKDVYSRLLPGDDARLTLPKVFLTILTHFLQMLRDDAASKHYKPSFYDRLLFSGNCPRYPVGVYDPLDVVHDLCSTLDILWEHKNTTRLNEFDYFKFNGLGLLQGRRRGKAGLETIIAYCGGFVKGKGKCGNSPLIIGKEATCPECGRLICPICDYCSQDCIRKGSHFEHAAFGVLP
jgi:hypothetical protein